MKDWFTKNDIDYLEETTLRREILPNKRSRTFVNDTPVSLEVLRSLSQKLMDIHAQYDNLLLKITVFS